MGISGGGKINLNAKITDFRRSGSLLVLQNALLISSLCSRIKQAYGKCMQLHAASDTKPESAANESALNECEDHYRVRIFERDSISHKAAQDRLKGSTEP